MAFGSFPRRRRTRVRTYVRTRVFPPAFAGCVSRYRVINRSKYVLRVFYAAAAIVFASRNRHSRERFDKSLKRRETRDRLGQLVLSIV